MMLADNRSEAVIIGTATLVLVLDDYYPAWNEWSSCLIYFFAIPVIVAAVFLRRNPLDFGLRPGSPRIWLFHTAVFCLVAWLVLLAAAGVPSLKEYYGKEEFSFLSYFVSTFASLFATEFLFRGFLLFGLKDRFKEGSIFVQTIPFVFIHLGKPMLETVSTIFTGVWFGYICYRGNSFWPAFIVHMFINVFFVASLNM
jgi:membrane protease YdiL (CAAX protease family)